MKRIEPKEVSARATKLYMDGLCCSEAVLYAMAEAYGEPPASFTRVGSGLCGGLGKGMVCGVVTASACSIGLFFGRESAQHTRSNAPSISAEYVSRFVKEHDNTDCSKLLSALLKGSSEQKKHCSNIVATGVEMACELINENISSDK